MIDYETFLNCYDLRCLSVGTSAIGQVDIPNSNFVFIKSGSGSGGESSGFVRDVVIAIFGRLVVRIIDFVVSFDLELELGDLGWCGCGLIGIRRIIGGVLLGLGLSLGFGSLLG